MKTNQINQGVRSDTADSSLEPVWSESIYERLKVKMDLHEAEDTPGAFVNLKNVWSVWSCQASYNCMSGLVSAYIHMQIRLKLLVPHNGESLGSLKLGNSTHSRHFSIWSILLDGKRNVFSPRTEVQLFVF